MRIIDFIQLPLSRSFDKHHNIKHNQLEALSLLLCRSKSLEDSQNKSEFLSFKRRLDTDLLMDSNSHLLMKEITTLFKKITFCHLLRVDIRSFGVTKKSTLSK